MPAHKLPSLWPDCPLPFPFEKPPARNLWLSGLRSFLQFLQRPEYEFQFPVRASTRNIIFPISVRASVQGIDYRAQVIRLRVLGSSCFPARVPEVNLTNTPFEIFNQYPPGYTLFNCSGRPDDRLSRSPIPCLDHGVYQVYAYSSFYTFSDVSISNCVKMYNISYTPAVLFNGPSQYSDDNTELHWPEPFCGDCERRRMYCRLRSNGTNNGTECVDGPRDPRHGTKGVSRNVIIAVVVVGFLLVVATIGGLYCLCNVKERKRGKSSSGL